ncbi:MAG: 5-oxoprolinase subunit PxpA [Pseudomonadota bacterium]
MPTIDLNSDLGEGYGPWSMGDDAAILAVVSSANVACGGHASDPDTMFKTLELAKTHGVTVGAHPGYADREGFGRRVIPMTTDAIARMCAAQIGALIGVAAQAGVPVRYVKPHGALANLAARDRSVADAIAGAVKAIDCTLAYLAISGTESEAAARAAGLPVYSEIFADRGYLSSGQLVPRGQDGAMITDPGAAADRLLAFLDTGRMPVIDGDPIALNAHSVCVHGDGAEAVAMAEQIRNRLRDAGVTIESFLTA